MRFTRGAALWTIPAVQLLRQVQLFGPGSASIAGSVQALRNVAMGPHAESPAGGLPNVKFTRAERTRGGAGLSGRRRASARRSESQPSARTPCRSPAAERGCTEPFRAQPHSPLVSSRTDASQPSGWCRRNGGPPCHDHAHRARNFDGTSLGGRIYFLDSCHARVLAHWAQPPGWIPRPSPAARQQKSTAARC